MRKLGQYFLRNRSVIDLIIQALEPKQGEMVIEIGPGHGELTIPLAASGVSVIAIEKDPVLAERLSSNAALKTIAGDAREVLPQLAAGFSAYKLAGNLPYYLTGFILRIISGLDPLPERCVFMLQKEVALRVSATAPEMNRLSASVQYWAEPRVIKIVSKKEFNPAPKVDSAVVLFETRPEARARTPEERERYYRAVRALFQQPGKTMLNNLLAAVSDRDRILKTLEMLAIQPSARPRTLSVELIERIAKELF